MRRAVATCGQWHLSPIAHSWRLASTRHSNRPFSPYDVSTWGITGTTDPAALAKKILPEVLKVAKEGKDPDFLQSVIVAQIKGYTTGEDIDFLKFLRPREATARGGMQVDVENLLVKTLNHSEMPPGMPLQGRGSVIDEVCQFLKVPPPKNTARLLLSPRGSGKTQLLKWVLGVELREMVGRGCVAVIESKRQTAPFYDIIKALPKEHRIDEDCVNAFLCAIVCRHLNIFHGKRTRHYVYKPSKRVGWLPPSDQPPGSLRTTYIQNISEAYDAWSAECGGGKLQLVLVFDTVEGLPRSTTVDCTKKPRKRSFLEQVTVSLPTARKVFFVGTQSGEVDTEELDPTDCRAKVLHPLRPLTFNEFRAAFAVWCTLSGVTSHTELNDVNTQRAARLVHELCGGLPRYLQHFAKSADSYPLLAVGVCWPSVIASGLSELKENFGKHTIAFHEVVGLLMAGTRYVVDDLDATVLGHPIRSLCAGLLLPVRYSKQWQFHVAPLLVKAVVDDAAVPRIMSKATTVPFPRGLRLSQLFVPDISMAFRDVCSNRNKVRGTNFEELVAHALVARHYLLSLLSGSRAVRLADLLGISPDSLPAAARDWVVDFSGGLIERTTDPTSTSREPRNRVVKSQQANAVHDIVFWAKGHDGEKRIALQLRHGGAKTSTQLSHQMAAGYNVALLLVVHHRAYHRPNMRGYLKQYKKRIIYVDASRFCFANTPYVVSPAEYDA